MIRRSTGLAAVALLLSLILHFLGISLSFTAKEQPYGLDSSADAVTLGESFDEIVDLRVEPLTFEPEQPVETPTPEEKPPEEPQEAEVPTTEVLVASPNPQNTFAPDTGFTPPTTQEIIAPATGEPAETPEPETTESSGGTESGIADARLSAPVGADPERATQSGAPASEVDVTPPAEPETVQDSTATAPVAVAPAPSPAPSVAPAPDIIAALPPEIADTVPLETVPPETDAEETPEAESSDTTLTTSLRPQSRPESLQTEEQGLFGDTETNTSVPAPTEIIESPLTAYSRDGVDLFAGQRSNSRSQASGFDGGRGPGNSNVTNYAGLVLVHLNRIPPVRVSARGWARVAFRINPDGSLASVDIIDGSGSSDIDRAARAQIRQGVPFPKPPDGQSKILSFVYRIR